MFDGSGPGGIGTGIHRAGHGDEEERAVPDRPALREFEVALMGGLVWLGTLFGVRVPVLACLFLLLIAVLINQKICLAIGLICLASSLSARANQQYLEHQETGFVSEQARVIGDSEPIGVGWKRDLKLSDGRRVEVVGFGSVASELTDLRVGDSAIVEGTIKPVAGQPWLKVRHIVGRLSATKVTPVGSRPIWRSPPEWLRSGVESSSQFLPEGQRSLYTGLVIGDDRFQTVDQKALFRAAGLSHLLAVSGQNVAFVLSLLSPMLFRLRITVRPVVVVLVLVIFAIATRGEPSVLRATVSAGLATVMSAGGLRLTGLRVLGITSIILLLVDPFLGRSIGFGLSISASAGILLWAPWLRARLNVPDVVASPLSVTVAAQLGVLPLLLYIFGPVSLASIPANLLAGWSAGVVMMWGLSVGLLAVVVPAGIGAVLQLPAALLVWWIGKVAEIANQLAFPVLGVVEVAVVLSALLILSLISSRPVRSVGLVLLVLGTILWVPATPTESTNLPGGRYIPSGEGKPSVLVVDRRSGGQLLDWVIKNRVRRIDIVIVEHGGRDSNHLMGALQNVVDIDILLAPSQHRIVGGTRVVSSMVVASRDGPIYVQNEESALKVVLPP